VNDDEGVWSAIGDLRSPAGLLDLLTPQGFNSAKKNPSAAVQQTDEEDSSAADGIVQRLRSDSRFDSFSILCETDKSSPPPEQLSRQIAS
jgi:hypothetical protein